MINRRQFMTNTVALAVTAAVAPPTMAAGCTCGGPSGPGIEWCDYCLATIDWQPVIRLKPNRTPTSGREITARQQEDGGLPVDDWWTKKFDELFEKHVACA